MIRRLLVYAAPRWPQPYTSRRLTVSSTTFKEVGEAQETSPTQRLDKPPDPFERHVNRRIGVLQLSLELPKHPPLPVDIREWKTVITAPSYKDLSSIGFDISRLRTAPTWVVMYLLALKIHSPSEAIQVPNLVYEHLPYAEESLRPSLIILSVRALSEHRTESPVEHLLETFLLLPLSNPTTHFDLLLQAMSHFHPSVQIAKLTVVILEAMQARRLRMGARTYKSLLSRRFVTLELAKMLQARMVSERYKPDVEDLEAYLRVFGKHGAVHACARYLNLIRKMRLEEGHIPPPHGVALTSSGVETRVSRSSVSSRTNTLFLRSLARAPGSAFEYLRSLVKEEALQSYLLQDKPLGLESSSRSPYGRYMSRHSTSGPTIHDWTTALHIAAKDRRCSNSSLLNMLERCIESGITPTTATFTVVMRGLIKKGGDYPSALNLWKRLHKSTKRKHRESKIDVKALTIGVDVLVGAGRALEAFETVLKQSKHDRFSPKGQCKPLCDIILMNAFMNSLLKHGWPGVIFPIWDALKPLFGVEPDAETLTVLLCAAREAERLDTSLRGFMGHVSSYNPFRSSSNDSSVPGNALAMTEEIRSLLHNDVADDTDPIADVNNRKVARKVAHRASSLWNGKPCGEKALSLFNTIVIGNFQQQHERPPATALCADNAQGIAPLRDVFKELTIGSGPEGSQASPMKGSTGDEGTMALSPYPQITPGEKTFAAYISLLGSQRRASEIPRTLAWMRSMEVVPRPATLSRALVLWAEVSLRGPLLEKYGNISEYQRLVGWLTEWLGEKSLPTDAQLNAASKQLKRDRER